MIGKIVYFKKYGLTGEGEVVAEQIIRHKEHISEAAWDNLSLFQRQGEYVFGPDGHTLVVKLRSGDYHRIRYQDIIP